LELLHALKTIEKQLGRLPDGPRWGPRVIDLDILLYDDLILSDADLYIPHVRLHDRLFVLEPLAQIAPDRRHPILQQTVRELRDQLLAMDTEDLPVVAGTENIQNPIFPEKSCAPVVAESR
jgi:2-amino-4-hydroxy-6-hydroxymethyldihydropteridine diphosphokinase